MYISLKEEHDLPCLVMQKSDGKLYFEGTRVSDKVEPAIYFMNIKAAFMLVTV